MTNLLTEKQNFYLSALLISFLIPIAVNEIQETAGMQNEM